jgi:hypothetical protein
MTAKCLICKHQHPKRTADALSCGVCKTCGMVLSSKRMTVRSAGKVYAFCCSTCTASYKKISALMKKKLRRGEITEKEFQDFERDVVI